MKKNIIIISLVYVILFSVSVTFAQDRLPVREYTPRDAIVTLDRTLSLDQSVRVLQEYSMKFENRSIINRTGTNQPIGVSIPGLYWYDALQMIANINRLVVREFPDRFEIIRVSEDESRESAKEDRDRRTPSRVIYNDTREIEISAIFFEGNRRYLREIGVNWSAIRDGVVSVTNFGASNVSEPQFNVDANVSEMVNTGDWQVDALLSTLEANNKGEILSSPTIKVMEGETGRIQVGQDFSIKQRDFAGNVIDQFFSTGTILTVTPWLIQDGGEEFIYMEINAERSSASPSTVSTIINKQEASTRVLMLSGETAAIAGLYETEENVIRRGVPFLKDLPGWFLGLRYLFGYESVDYTEKELVIVIKAELVPKLRDRGILDGSGRDFIQQEIERYRETIQ